MQTETQGYRGGKRGQAEQRESYVGIGSGKVKWGPVAIAAEEAILAAYQQQISQGS